MFSLVPICFIFVRGWKLERPGAGVVRFALFLVLIGGLGYLADDLRPCSAQTTQPPTIRVETREVILPVCVIEERKDPKGLLVGPNGEEFHVWIYHTREVTGLAAKSFRIFEDGVEQTIKHFSVERKNGWLVRDNVGEHVEHAWTPSGIWSAADKKQMPNRASSLPIYLITYTPPPSPAGSWRVARPTASPEHRPASKKNPRGCPILTSRCSTLGWGSRWDCHILSLYDTPARTLLLQYTWFNSRNFKHFLRPCKYIPVHGNVPHGTLGRFALAFRTEH
jgi:hypothetical protein